MLTIELWDNGGESFDRYTLIIDDDAWGLSVDQSPRGFCQYLGKVADEYIPMSDIGVVREYLDDECEEIELIDAPDSVRHKIENIFHDQIYSEEELCESYRESLRDNKRSGMHCELCKSFMESTLCEECKEAIL